MTEPIRAAAERMFTTAPRGSNALDLTEAERQALEGQLEQIRAAHARGDLDALRALAGVPANVPDARVESVVLRILQSLRTRATSNARAELQQYDRLFQRMVESPPSSVEDAVAIHDGMAADLASHVQLGRLDASIGSTLDALRTPKSAGATKPR